MKFAVSRKAIPLSLLIAVMLLGGCKGPRKDFEVVPTTSPDPNGFLFNPEWGKQADQHVVPDTKSCPIAEGLYKREIWNDNSGLFPNCTSYPVTFTGGFFCGPHVNFEPVTYEGTVFWDGYNAGDSDYDLNVKRDDELLYSTAGGEVHIEFDSDETVDHWDDTGTWFDNFHHNGVDHYSQDAEGHWFYDGYSHASDMINGSHVLVIGQLGMDTYHRGKTELHPIYAMFVRLKSDDVRNISYAFFVRNWGDEGFCSDGDQPLETKDHVIKVRIPNVAGLEANNVSQGAQNQDDLSAMQVALQPAGDGALLTFTLLPPDKQSWFVGDLTFAAPLTQTSARATPAAQPAAIPAQEKEEDELPPDLRALQAKVQKLSPDDRHTLDLELKKLTTGKKSSPAKLKILFEPAKNEATRRLSFPVQPERVPPHGKTALQLRVEQKAAYVKSYLAKHGIE
jgi:hypothetical protein